MNACTSKRRAFSVRALLECMHSKRMHGASPSKTPVRACTVLERANQHYHGTRDCNSFGLMANPRPAEPIVSMEYGK